MAIIELQMAADRFCAYVKGEINSRPLPFDNVTAMTLLNASLDLDGYAVDRIECTGCTVDQSASRGGALTLAATVDVHYIASREALLGGGSMQPPPTEIVTLPTALAITLELGAHGAVLKWSASQLHQGDALPFPLPEGISAAGTAIVSSGNLVAVRIATQKSDAVVDLPIMNRLAGQDWNLLVPGQIFAEVMIAQLDAQLRDAVGPDTKMTKRPRGSWDALARVAVAWAEMTATAKDEVGPLSVSVPVDFTLTCHLTLNGVFLTTTAVLEWKADDTWASVLGGAVFPALRWWVLDKQDREASKRVFALAQEPEDYEKIGETESSVTYGRTLTLRPPTDRFFVANTAVTWLGVELSGSLRPRPGLQGVNGEVTLPEWGFTLSCSPVSAGVGWFPGRISLFSLYGPVPPTLFAQFTDFTPGGAWGVSYDYTAHASNELKLVFADPPGGRLPVGTATKVILFTNCGVRWADLGVIPEDVLSGDPALVESMQDVAYARCKAISMRWGERPDAATIFQWMLNPLLDPDPDRSRAVAPLRLWNVLIPRMSPSAQLDFFGLTDDAVERPIGSLAGQRAAMLQFVTGADELLAVRASEEVDPDGVRMSQAWLAPVSVVPGRGLYPVSFNDEDNVIELEASGEVGDLLSAEVSTNGAHGFRVRLEAERDGGPPVWARTLRLDRQTMAVAYRGQIVVATKSDTVRIR